MKLLELRSRTTSPDARVKFKNTFVDSKTLEIIKRFAPIN